MIDTHTKVSQNDSLVRNYKLVSHLLKNFHGWAKFFSNFFEDKKKKIDSLFFKKTRVKTSKESLKRICRLFKELFTLVFTPF